MSLCGLGLLGLLGSASAQEASGPERRLPLRGEVVDRAGNPQPGARVVLFSRLVRGFDLGLGDRIEVLCDARGEFRTAPLAQREYSAWAAFPKPGGTGVTDVAAAVFPDRFLTLRESPRDHPAITVQLRGCVQWRDAAPLTLRVALVPSRLPVLERVLERDTSIPLPPLPAAFEVDVTGGDGRVIESRRLPVTDGGWEVRAELDDMRLRTARRNVVKFTPVVGHYEELLAAARRRTPPDPAEVRRLEAEVLAHRARLAWSEWRVRYLPRPLDLTQPVLDLPSPRRPPCPAWPGIEPPKTVRGRVVSGGRGVPGLGVLIRYRQGHGAARTGADGGFVVPGVASKESLTVLVALPRALWPTGDDGVDPYPLAWVRGPLAVPPGSDIDVGEVSLDALHRVSLRVSDDRGAPAVRAAVVVAAASSPRVLPLLRFATDHAGRGRIAVPPSSELYVGAAASGGFAFAHLGPELPARLALSMQRGFEIAGTVTFANGEPVHGATVRVEPDVRALSRSALSAIATPFELFEDELRVRTGTDGSFRLLVLPIPSSWRVIAELNKGTATRVNEVSVAADREPVRGGIRLH